jgi:PKD repeat protein
MKTILFTMMALIVSVTVSAQLDPDFSPNHNIETCGPTDVYFVCTAPQGADNIWWDFGDGTTATGLTPVHNYSTTGTYDVKMIVEKGGVKDSITKPGFVVIKPAPQAAFILDTSVVTPPPFIRKFLFTGFSNADSISEYFWTVNDAIAQGGEIMNYTFPENGDYKIGLVITNNKGCSDEFIDTITVVDSPEQPSGIEETQKKRFSQCLLYMTSPSY